MSRKHFKWPVDNMKKTGLTGYVYNFSVDYDIVPAVSIPHIHKNLMIKNDMT